jgi:uncharacterized protein (DUF3084 family)
MLKSFAINNNRAISQKNKKKLKKTKKLHNLFIQNISNNAMNPIKIFKGNFTGYNKNDDSSTETTDIPKKNKTKNFNKTSELFYDSKKGKKCKTIESYKNSFPKKQNKKRSFSKKSIDISGINDLNILNLERRLTRNERKFKRNVSQKIIKNKKINEQLNSNVELLKNEINNNYGELTKTKYNFYNINNNTITTLYNNRIMKLQNRTNHQKINDLKNNIKDIKNKIEQFNRKTAFYTNEYMIVNNEVSNLKKQCKILPNLIDNLENENQAIISTKNFLQKSIQKIKSKLLEFELYKKNIERNLKNANMLYE